MWNSSEDIMKAIHAAHERLVAGETPVDQAHAEARILATSVKLIGVQLEHAKLTGRMEQGSPVLPGFVSE